MESEPREDLLQRLREDGHLRTERVEQALRAVAREEFLPPEARAHAYLDRPLEIGQGQTISAPHMVAIMSEALQVEAGQNVLEVGTGSGYQAAVLAHLVGDAGRVTTIERVPELAQRAQESLRRSGAQNVQVQVGDGSKGYPENAPYDRILVTAAAPRLPPPLVRQLAPDGILVAPVGGQLCDLVRARKEPTGLATELLGKCAFVPLKGAHGQRFRFFGR